MKREKLSALELLRARIEELKEALEAKYLLPRRKRLIDETLSVNILIYEYLKD